MAPAPASQRISGNIDILMAILNALDRSSVALMHYSCCIHLGTTVQPTKAMLPR